MDRTRYRWLFVAEARRALAEAEAELLLAPEAAPGDPRALLRSLHTLKGMSATMELAAIVTLAHAVEDVCEGLARGALAPDTATRALLAEAIVHLRGQVQEVELGREPVGAQHLVDELRAHVTAGTHTGFRRLPADAERDDDEAPRAATAEPTGAAEDARVEVPFATVLPPLRRHLHALCRELGREARLEVHGEVDVHVDPEVLGPLQAALVQLLNNALAHGIERPEERGGKDPAGRIGLAVERFVVPPLSSDALSRVHHRLRVRFTDDGRGLDADALRAAAGEPGADPLELALRPGLSTSAEPGPVAGRGHGLPAVWHLVAALRGRIDLESSPAGTRLCIEVPLRAGLEPLTAAPDGHILPVIDPSSALPPRGSS